MRNQLEAEVKRVKSKRETAELHRDPGMTGGERAETADERRHRSRSKGKAKEAPIIQKTPEGGVE